MRAAASVQFTGYVEKCFSAPQKDRQLQLVLGAEVAAPEPPAEGEGGNPRPSIAPSGCVVGSLAEYALGLRAGDPCFCCGGTLAASAPGEGTGEDSGEGVGKGGAAGAGEGPDAAGEERSVLLLVCPECGASVGGPG